MSPPRVSHALLLISYDGDDKGLSKTGEGRLTREETLNKKAVEEGRVSWRTIFLKDEEMGESGGVQ